MTPRSSQRLVATATFCCVIIEVHVVACDGDIIYLSAFYWLSSSSSGLLLTQNARTKETIKPTKNGKRGTVHNVMTTMMTTEAEFTPGYDSSTPETDDCRERNQFGMSLKESTIRGTSCKIWPQGFIIQGPSVWWCRKTEIWVGALVILRSALTFRRRPDETQLESGAIVLP